MTNMIGNLCITEQELSLLIEIVNDQEVFPLDSFGDIYRTEFGSLVLDIQFLNSGKLTDLSVIMMNGKYNIICDPYSSQAWNTT